MLQSFELELPVVGISDREEVSDEIKQEKLKTAELIKELIEIITEPGQAEDMCLLACNLLRRYYLVDSVQVQLRRLLLNQLTDPVKKTVSSLIAESGGYGQYDNFF